MTKSACDHQEKKYVYRMKETIFNRFHTLIPVSISNRLRSIWCSQPCSACD